MSRQRGDDEDDDRPIKSDYKEGANWNENDDGSRHETRWYDTGAGSSARTSCDVSNDGGTSDEHTTVQK